MECRLGHVIKVLKSHAGFYIGTLDECNMPYCRLSAYFKTENEARAALEHGFELRDSIETNWCCSQK